MHRIKHACMRIHTPVLAYAPAAISKPLPWRYYLCRYQWPSPSAAASSPSSSLVTLPITAFHICHSFPSQHLDEPAKTMLQWQVPVFSSNIIQNSSSLSVLPSGCYTCSRSIIAGCSCSLEKRGALRVGGKWVFLPVILLSLRRARRVFHFHSGIKPFPLKGGTE